MTNHNLEAGHGAVLNRITPKPLQPLLTQEQRWSISHETATIQGKKRSKNLACQKTEGTCTSASVKMSLVLCNYNHIYMYQATQSLTLDMLDLVTLYNCGAEQSTCT